MSILFGIINYKKKPIPAEYIARMRESLLFSNPNKIVEWNNANYYGGVMHRYNTPESTKDIFPLKSISDSFIFSSAGRIDNREELINKLSISTNNSTISDSTLMHRAWEKWGKECVHHLIGDWSFVCVDEKSDDLFLARDHSGNTTFFYYSNSEYFVYCSSLKGILSLPFVNKTINELKLASLLTAWRSSAAFTSYKNIHALAPAHWLHWKNNSCQVQQYWNPSEIPPLKLKNEDDYFEAFYELFSETVKNRLRSIHPIAVCLSSGLDSGAVTSIASTHLQKSDQRITAYTSAPYYNASNLIPSSKITDESALVKSYLDCHNNIDLAIVRSENTSIFSNIKKVLDIYSEPTSAIANHYWMHDIFELAKEKNTGVLLTGQGGNFTVSWPTGGFSERINNKKRIDLRLSNFSSFVKFRRAVIVPLLPDSILNTYVSLNQGREPWIDNSMIGKDFAKKVKLKENIRASKWYPPKYQASGMHEAQSISLNPAFSMAGYYHAPISQYFGFEDSDPTLDKRIIEFCLSIPNFIYVSKDQSRRLIRTGMKDYLPAPIINNTKRGQQAADIIPRMNAQKQDWISFMERVNQSSFIGNYLDTTKMNAFINEVINSKTKNYSDVYKFLRAAAVFEFLDTFLSEKI